MSHLLRVDLVVLGVRSHKPDVDHPIGVVDPHHEPVVVALDVEHHAVVADDARASVLLLDLRGGIPILLLDLAVPREQRLFRVSVLLPKLAESFLRDDPHALCTSVPFSSKALCSQNDTKSILDPYGR